MTAAILLGAFLTVFATLMLSVAWTVQQERHDQTGDEPEYVIARCPGGHYYRRQPAPTIWRCATCGDRVESSTGWVGPS